MSLLAEFKRRSVFKMGVAYLVAAIVLVLVALALGDIPRATVEVRRIVRAPDSTTLFVLLNGPAGARLAEEISQDPAWLAVWDDPQLHEVMLAFRANLARYRKGG